MFFIKKTKYMTIFHKSRRKRNVTAPSSPNRPVSGLSGLNEPLKLQASMRRYIHRCLMFDMSAVDGERITSKLHRTWRLEIYHQLNLSKNSL